jgi:exonuclease SbcD
MRFLHLADLHIGKRVNEFNLLEDQRHILRQILKIADANRPDAVLVAGDLYDRSVPPGEAVELLDEFFTQFSSRGLPVFAVSGNHDSPERLDFGSRIMRRNGVTIAGSFRGHLEKTALSDGYGPVNVWLLPFLKPAMASPFFPPERVGSYEDAVRAAIGAQKIDPDERNVLVAHQFVTAFGKNRRPATPRPFRSAGPTRWTLPYSTLSTTLRWDTCTARSASAGRKCVTPVRR